MNNKKRDCFATLAMTGKKAFAFTLSEVLIVLAVLGVVAAMTIPDLIQDAREKALITALKKNYTVFSQAFDMAVAENGAVNTWGVFSYSNGSSILYNVLKSHLRIEKYCGKSSGCLAEHYEALFNTDFTYQPDTLGSFVKGTLGSGASFFIYSPVCYVDYCGFIGVDVNGKSGPNKAGVDLFYFFISLSGYLEPAGRSDVIYEEKICSYKPANAYNGAGCAYWALKHENMDYLRKSGKYVGY